MSIHPFFFVLNLLNGISHMAFYKTVLHSFARYFSYEKSNWKMSVPVKRKSIIINRICSKWILKLACCYKHLWKIGARYPEHFLQKRSMKKISKRKLHLVRNFSWARKLKIIFKNWIGNWISNLWLLIRRITLSCTFLNVVSYINLVV